MNLDSRLRGNDCENQTMKLWKQTLALRAFGLWKVPLIFLVNPWVRALNDELCEIVIPLNRLTRNHLRSMYFGTLAIGADCAGGLLAMSQIRKSKKKISLVFKDFKADFLKRPEADVHFLCKEGEKIREMVKETLKTQKRVNRPIRITARTPKKLGKDPVAEFELTLSLKAQ